jgi:hypothetical protein
MSVISLREATVKEFYAAVAVCEAIPGASARGFDLDEAVAAALAIRGLQALWWMYSQLDKDDREYIPEAH